MFEQEYNYHDKLWPDTKNRTQKLINKIGNLEKTLKKARENLAKEQESVAATQHRINVIKQGMALSLQPESETNFTKFRESLAKRRNDYSIGQEIITSFEKVVIPELMRDLDTAKQNLIITLHQCLTESLPTANQRQGYIRNMQTADMNSFENCWRRIFADLGLTLCINTPDMMPEGWETTASPQEPKAETIAEPVIEPVIEPPKPKILSGVIPQIKKFVLPKTKPDTKEPAMNPGSRRNPATA